MENQACCHRCGRRLKKPENPKAQRAHHFHTRQAFFLGQDETGHPYHLTPTANGTWLTPTGLEISHARLGSYLHNYQLI